MNNDFYHRQKAAEQDAERQRAVSERHSTLEVWQLEQEAAQHSTVESPMSETKTVIEKPAGLIARIKRALGLK